MDATPRTSFELDGVRVFTLWDDAMVSMRYAGHLAAGRGLTWNDGERVQGFSNPGVTLLMALLHLLPLAKEEGVAFVAGPDFMIEGGHESLRLSFASVHPQDVPEGICRLARGL